MENIEEIFNEILNTVVNNKIDGNVDIFNTSDANNALNKIIMEIEMFSAINTSNNAVGSGTNIKMMAAII